MTWVFRLFLARPAYNLGANDASYPPGMESESPPQEFENDACHWAAYLWQFRMSYGRLHLHIRNAVVTRQSQPQSQSESQTQSQAHFPRFSYFFPSLSVMPSARLACLFIYILYMTVSCFPCCFLNEISRVACRQNKECINYPIPGGSA